MHGTIVGQRSGNNNGRSYKIKVTQMGCMITRTKRHMKATTTTAEHCLRNEVMKANQPQMVGRCNELIDVFAQIHKQKRKRVQQ